MGTLGKLELVDFIHRMSQKSFMKINFSKPPRQIDIVTRYMAENPKDYSSKDSLKVIVHRNVRTLLSDGYIFKDAEKRYRLTPEGNFYRLSNLRKLKTSEKLYWDEINKGRAHVSFAINHSSLIIEGRREEKIKQKLEKFLDDLSNNYKMEFNALIKIEKEKN